MATATADTTEECEVCSSGDPPTGRGFQHTWEASQRHFENVNNQWVKYDLPPLNGTVRWRVYELSSEIMDHFSLYFECESSQYRQSPGFCIWLKIASRGVVVPIANVYRVDPTWKEDFPCLGTITSSAKEIMNVNLECLEEFGDYHYLSNNCIHYCTKLAKRLGLRQIRKMREAKKPREGWSTGEKALAWGVAGAVLGGLAALMLGGGENEERQEERRRR